MATFCILCAAVLAAGDRSDGKTTTPPTPQELRATIHDALRREARSEGAAHERAIVDLTDAFQALQADTQLGDAQRKELLAQVRSRLSQTAQAMKKKAAQADKDAAKKRLRQGGSPPRRIGPRRLNPRRGVPRVAQEIRCSAMGIKRPVARRVSPARRRMPRN